MTASFDDVVVVAAFDRERPVCRRGGRSSLCIRVGADELDRAAELTGLRPKIERHRGGIDAGLVLWIADQDEAVAARILAQDTTGHQFVLALDPVPRRA